MACKDVDKSLFYQCTYHGKKHIQALGQIVCKQADTYQITLHFDILRQTKTPLYKSKNGSWLICRKQIKMKKKSTGERTEPNIDIEIIKKDYLIFQSFLITNWAIIECALKGHVMSSFHFRLFSFHVIPFGWSDRVLGYVNIYRWAQPDGCRHTNNTCGTDQRFIFWSKTGTHTNWREPNSLGRKFDFAVELQ